MKNPQQKFQTTNQTLIEQNYNDEEFLQKLSQITNELKDLVQNQDKTNPIDSLHLLKKLSKLGINFEDRNISLDEVCDNLSSLIQGIVLRQLKDLENNKVWENSIQKSLPYINLIFNLCLEYKGPIAKTGYDIVTSLVNAFAQSPNLATIPQASVGALSEFIPSLASTIIEQAGSLSLQSTSGIITCLTYLYQVTPGMAESNHEYTNDLQDYLKRSEGGELSKLIQKSIDEVQSPANTNNPDKANNLNKQTIRKLQQDEPEIEIQTTTQTSSLGSAEISTPEIAAIYDNSGEFIGKIAQTYVDHSAGSSVVKLSIIDSDTSQVIEGSEVTVVSSGTNPKIIYDASNNAIIIAIINNGDAAVYRFNYNPNTDIKPSLHAAHLDEIGPDLKDPHLCILSDGNYRLTCTMMATDETILRTDLTASGLTIVGVSTVPTQTGSQLSVDTSQNYFLQRSESNLAIQNLDDGAALHPIANDLLSNADTVYTGTIALQKAQDNNNLFAAYVKNDGVNTQYGNIVVKKCDGSDLTAACDVVDLEILPQFSKGSNPKFTLNGHDIVTLSYISPVNQNGVDGNNYHLYSLSFRSDLSEIGTIKYLGEVRDLDSETSSSKDVASGVVNTQDNVNGGHIAIYTDQARQASWTVGQASVVVDLGLGVSTSGVDTGAGASTSGVGTNAGTSSTGVGTGAATATGDTGLSGSTSGVEASTSSTGATVTSSGTAGVEAGTSSSTGSVDNPADSSATGLTGGSGSDEASTTGGAGNSDTGTGSEGNDEENESGQGGSGDQSASSGDASSGNGEYEENEPKTTESASTSYGTSTSATSAKPDDTATSGATTGPAEDNSDGQNSQSDIQAPNTQLAQRENDDNIGVIAPIVATLLFCVMLVGSIFGIRSKNARKHRIDPERGGEQNPGGRDVSGDRQVIKNTSSQTKREIPGSTTQQRKVAKSSNAELGNPTNLSEKLSAAGASTQPTQETLTLNPQVQVSDEDSGHEMDTRSSKRRAIDRLVGSPTRHSRLAGKEEEIIPPLEKEVIPPLEDDIATTSNAASTFNPKAIAKPLAPSRPSPRTTQDDGSEKDKGTNNQGSFFNALKAAAYSILFREHEEEVSVREEKQEPSSSEGNSSQPSSTQSNPPVIASIAPNIASDDLPPPPFPPPPYDGPYTPVKQGAVHLPEVQSDSGYYRRALDAHKKEADRLREEAKEAKEEAKEAKEEAKEAKEEAQEERNRRISAEKKFERRQQALQESPVHVESPKPPVETSTIYTPKPVAITQSTRSQQRSQPPRAQTVIGFARELGYSSQEEQSDKTPSREKSQRESSDRSPEPVGLPPLQEENQWVKEESSNISR